MSNIQHGDAVVLVHGIGNQSQRETLEAFLGSLDRIGVARPNRERVLRQLDATNPGESYFLAHVDIDGRPVKVAEFFWADISRVQSGMFSILRNFFQLIVDAPDIIYACFAPRVTNGQERDFFVLRCLRSLFAVMIWMIYFPIIGINVAYALLVGEFAVHAARDASVSLATPADLPFAIFSGVAAVLLLVLSAQRKIYAYARAILLIVAAVLLVVLAWSANNLLLVDRIASYSDYATVFNDILNGLWGVVIVISLIYLLVLPLLWIAFMRRWRSLLLGFTVAFLVIRFWLAFITTLWLVYLTSVFDAKTYDSLISNIGGPIRFVSLMWFDVMIIGLVLATSLMSHIWQTAASEGRVTGRRYPRLIIPSVLPFLAMLLSLTGLAIIAACNCAQILDHCPMVTCEIIYEPSEWIIAHAATLLAVGGILVQIAHSRFDVAIDIVNFFKSDRGHRKINPFSAVASVFQFAPQQDIELRQHLQERFERMLADVQTAHGPFRKVLFVGQSLGSMVAISHFDVVTKTDSNEQVSEIITLGSPYAAIFHHYFPHIFAPPSLQLVSGASNWSNVYRENDYVGTELGNEASGIVNVALPPLGHLGYFADDSGARIVVDRLIKPKSSGVGTHDHRTR